MKDLVTTGTGNSRYLKSGISDGTTWAEALALLRAGTFPVDFNGLNNAGISQQGSAYSKANVLPDALCTALGIDLNNSEPKDALAALLALLETANQTFSDFVSNDYSYPYKLALSRPNILDNWYFAGGGSQLGEGKFPINQKGSTSYTAAGYGVDRWKKANTNGSVSLGSSGMTVVGTGSAWNYLDQPIEFSNRLFGKQVTITILNTSGALATATYTLPASLPSSETTYATTSAVGSVSIQVMGNSSYFFARIRCQAASSTAVQAVKLEIGPNQTLARQSGNTWILNELPDFQTELAKCQRFMLVFNRHTSGANPSITDGIGSGTFYEDRDFAGFIATPVPLRKIPSYSGTLALFYKGVNGPDYISMTTSTRTPLFYLHPNGLAVRGTGMGTTSASHYGEHIIIAPYSSCTLDANL